jgi:hypothetical protein
MTRAKSKDLLISNLMISLVSIRPFHSSTNLRLTTGL